MSFFLFCWLTSLVLVNFCCTFAISGLLLFYFVVLGMLTISDFINILVSYYKSPMVSQMPILAGFCYAKRIAKCKLYIVISRMQML